MPTGEEVRARSSVCYDGHAGNGLRLIFTITLFLSSALLFLVQPMVAKMVLPRFGGTPMVWSGSILFFQAVLLLGYLYAHLSGRWLRPRVQVIVHLVLMAGALLTLPIAIPAGLGALGSGSPLGPLMASLALGVGLVFFGLSAGAPMIQGWFARTSDPHARDPYFLYAASNVGSMLALIAYPTLVEPRLTLLEQSELWRVLYGVLVFGMIGIGVLGLRSKPPESLAEPASSADSEAPEPPTDVAPTWGQRGRWVLYALIPSSLMLGLTTYFTTNLAPIPLLWVIPLSLYLLTFILAFARRRWIPTLWASRLLPMLVVPIVLALAIESDEHLLLVGGLHLLTFFVAALVCHSRMVDERPSPRHLTEFYLWMSVGGVLGGLFNTVGAPILFQSISEYPLMIVLACLVRPWPQPGKKNGLADWAYPVGIAAFTAILIVSFPRMDAEVFRGWLYGLENGGPDRIDSRVLRNLWCIGLPVIAAFFAVDRPMRFGLSIGAVLLMIAQFRLNSPSETLFASRNFFGVHRVLLSGASPDFAGYHRLVHGNTTHGQQSLDLARRNVPLTYYWTGSGVGQVMQHYAGSPKRKNVGLIGLGIGTLAAYGRPGEVFHFHEIDPQIVEIAQDPKLFSFLSDSKAEIKITLGDARLTMAQEPPGSYGIIVVDAFSSDAIPIHLITREAVQMLMDRLQPDGILLYHISNRFLNLEPVLGNIGRALGLQTLSQYVVCSFDERLLGYSDTNYVLLTRSGTDLKSLQNKQPWFEAETRPEIGVWTDDYSNVLSVMKQLRGE
ncbi:MAG TPA: fused MFS/spermidine synthase [Fimbriimonadaceae bacterium]|nr:fused MFS/spermidine synthase [Fimbriimonadaceae bacterium]HRJ33174.1 fused MFS/spermidine synthase [Fimbriimonadaceae bacterium]